MLEQEQNGTLLQNLRNFTVQIRDAETDRIVGTGLAITMDGRIIICAHVVYAALLVHPRDAANAALGSLQQAFSDLREALSYATDGGYRIYEADGRIALAWAHLAGGTPTAAKQEATRAQTLSIDMGYHWGQLDAAEVLALL